MQSTKLRLEPHNFLVKEINGVQPTEWKQDGDLFVAPTGDVWAVEPTPESEQLFTWEAAMRETERAGLRMPTDEELSELIKTAEDVTNLVFPGFRNPNGSHYNRGTDTHLWSSTESGSSAGTRYLHASKSTVYRGTYGQGLGFSVRCIQTKPDSSPLYTINPATVTMEGQAMNAEELAQFIADKQADRDGLNKVLRVARQALSKIK